MTCNAEGQEGGAVEEEHIVSVDSRASTSRAERTAFFGDDGKRGSLVNRSMVRLGGAAMELGAMEKCVRVIEDKCNASLLDDDDDDDDDNCSPSSPLTLYPSLFVRRALPRVSPFLIDSHTRICPRKSHSEHVCSTTNTFPRLRAFISCLSHIEQLLYQLVC